MKPFVRDVASWLLDMVPGAASIGRAADRLFIATFHRVLPASQLDEYPLPGLAVTPSQFEWYVRFFARYFDCVRLDDAWDKLASRQKRAKPLLAVTFDDGQLDNYLHAAPVLKMHRIAATFFVPVEAVQTGSLLWHDRMAYAARALTSHYEHASLLAELGVEGDTSRDMPRTGVRNAKHWSHDRRLDWIRRAELAVPKAIPEWDGMMKWTQLLELVGEGHEIGSHSFSHVLLDQCDVPTLDVEIASSRKILQEALGQEILSFCYPNGNTDARVASLVEAAGYKVGVTTSWGSNTAGSSPFLLKRHDMVSSNSMNRHGELSERRLRQRMLGYVRGAS